MRKSNKLLLALILALSTFGGNAFAALTNDSVLSQHIKEADGTTGQNTATGSGIKTGHIQDNAVTTSKIADGAITSGKIADGIITGQKILDGAITDTKIIGPISVDKLQTYKNVRIVHGGNVDGVNTFATITAALNSITDASLSNPYVIFVMPGIYNETVTMKDWVSIKGSGQLCTKISTASDPGVIGANNASLEDLWVEIINPSGSQQTALRIAGTSPLLRNCTFRNPFNSYSFGVTVYGGSPVFENCTILYNGSREATGVYISGSNSMPVFKNTTVNVDNEGTSGYRSTAIYIWPYDFASVNVDNCKLGCRLGLSDSHAIEFEGNSGNVRVSSSMLDGDFVTYGPGVIKLINCFDINYNAIPNQ